MRKMVKWKIERRLRKSVKIKFYNFPKVKKLNILCCIKYSVLMKKKVKYYLICFLNANRITNVPKTCFLFIVQRNKSYLVNGGYVSLYFYKRFKCKRYSKCREKQIKYATAIRTEWEGV